MAIASETIESIIQEILTGKMPTKIKDGDQEVELRVPSLQQLIQALNDAKMSDEGIEGGPFNLATFDE